MTKGELDKLEIGDYVQITSYGKNKGKIGEVVKFIYLRGDPSQPKKILVSPVEGRFEFANKFQRGKKFGYFAFNSANLRYLGKEPTLPPNKTMHVLVWFEGYSRTFKLTDYTEKELRVIKRFAKELTECNHVVAIKCEYKEG